jgi:hypothetical protein
MFSKEKNSMETIMNAVNTVSEIHHLGEYVTGQNEGRKDEAITGNDLYNFAVQTDANFMTVRGDIRNMDIVMNSDFKLVRMEMASGFAAVDAQFDGVDNEFKLVRMEMASGFAAVDARFDGVDAQFAAIDARFVAVDAEFKVVRAEMREGFAKLPITITVWVCSTMIALIGLVATVAAIVINQIK